MAAFLQQSLSTPDSTTNASFRLWGTYVRDAIMNSGFTMVGTGNIDWTTVAAPAGATTAQGFEVYQFNDTLQATNPYFFKIEYGSAGSGTRPALWITIGRGHNGTGTITANGGALTTRAQVTRNSSSLNPYISYIAGQSNGAFGYLSLALWTNRSNVSTGPSVVPKDTSTPQGVFLSIERTKDSTGADTSDGLLLTYIIAQSSYSCQYVGNTANGNVETTLGILTPGQTPMSGASLLAASGVNGPKSAQRWGFYPVFHNKKGQMLYPGKNIIVAYNPGPGDLAGDHFGEFWSPTQYGQQRTMVYHGDNIFTNLTSPGRFSASNTQLLTRFD